MWDNFFICTLMGFGLGLLSSIVTGSITSVIKFFKSFI